MENVKNNMEKYFSYKTQIEKYNRAMQEGFYYEAILISYAIMEDRLMTILENMGFVIMSKTDETKKFVVSEKVRPFMRSLINEKKPNIQNISVKRKLIESILILTYEQAEQYEKEYAEKQKTTEMNGYLQELYMDIDESVIDRSKAIEMLKKQEEWCERRNKLIHSLLNIQIDESFDEDVKTLAKESLTIWRYFDNDLAAKLKNCKLREKYHIE